MVLCGVSAVSAASDNAVDNLTSDMDDSFLVSNNLNAVGVDESASVAQENDDGLFGQSRRILILKVIYLLLMKLVLIMDCLKVLRTLFLKVTLMLYG